MIAPLTFGALLLGCTIVWPLTCGSQAESQYFLSKTMPEFLICELKFYEMLQNFLRNLEINAIIFTIDGQAGTSIAIQSLFEITDDSFFEYVLYSFQEQTHK